MAYPVQHLGHCHLPNVRVTADLAKKLPECRVALGHIVEPRGVQRDHEWGAVPLVVSLEVVTQVLDDLILAGVAVCEAAVRHGARPPARVVLLEQGHFPQLRVATRRAALLVANGLRGAWGVVQGEGPQRLGGVVLLGAAPEHGRVVEEAIAHQHGELVLSPQLQEGRPHPSDLLHGYTDALRQSPPHPLDLLVPVLAAPVGGRRVGVGVRRRFVAPLHQSPHQGHVGPGAADEEVGGGTATVGVPSGLLPGLGEETLEVVEVIGLDGVVESEQNHLRDFGGVEASWDVRSHAAAVRQLAAPRVARAFGVRCACFLCFSPRAEEIVVSGRGEAIVIGRVEGIIVSGRGEAIVIGRVEGIIVSGCVEVILPSSSGAVEIFQVLVILRDRVCGLVWKTKHQI